MGDYTTSIIIVLLFLLGIFWYSQTKFKNKMLCYFLRPNKQRVKKWVPLYSRHVVFDRGKYGIQQYRVNPKCIVLEWWTGGINKFFPTLVPTLDFRWDSPNPIDPETSVSSWHTPEVEAAGYQGHGYTAFARAAMQQAGGKRDKLQWLITIAILGAIIIVAIVGFQYMGSLNEQLGQIQQQINNIRTP
jgi:hypothetical protein